MGLFSRKPVPNRINSQVQTWPLVPWGRYYRPVQSAVEPGGTTPQVPKRGEPNILVGKKLKVEWYRQHGYGMNANLPSPIVYYK